MKKTNEFKYYPFPAQQAEQLERVKSSIRTAIDRYMMRENKHIASIHELPKHKLEEAIIEGIYTHFLSQHSDDIGINEVVRDKEMMETLIKRIKSDKEWKHGREVGVDRSKVSKSEKILDEVEMYALYFTDEKESKNVKNMDGYEQFLKVKLGDEKFAKSKQGYMAHAIQKQMSEQKQEFIEQNQDKYVEYLKTIFSPEKRYAHTALDVKIAAEGLQLSGLELGIRLERDEKEKPGVIIFQVRGKQIGEWTELGRIETKDKIPVGRVDQREFKQLRNKHAQATGNIKEQNVNAKAIAGVNRTSENQVMAIATKLVQREKGEKWKFDHNYPPLSAEMREVFCQALFASRDILSVKEKDTSIEQDKQK
ncbi:MAG: hypothetical protein FWE45_04025 [Firmicutes bacterium]|nr:hypothetical protein [Bacillota bacterium]